MGKGAFLRIENHIEEMFRITYKDLSCMHQGGKEGSDFAPISGRIGPKGKLPGKADWQYIEKDGSCWIDDGIFTLIVNNSVDHEVACLKFKANMGGYRIESGTPEPEHGKWVKVEITHHDTQDEIVVSILQKLDLDFSRPIRLRLYTQLYNPLYHSFKDICFLRASDEKYSDGSYLLGMKGGGFDYQSTQGYHRVPTALIESDSQSHSGSKSGVVVAFPSSDPLKPTLYLTNEVKKLTYNIGETNFFKGLECVVLSSERRNAVRLHPKISDLGLSFGRDDGLLLSIFGANIRYDTAGSENGLFSGTPHIQYFHFPDWDKRYRQWRKKLVIGTEIENSKCYIGVTNGEVTVVNQPHEWHLLSDPFSLDFAEGCFLYSGKLFLARQTERPERFYMTPEIDKALRVLPIHFGETTFGLRLSDSLNEWVTIYDTSLYPKNMTVRVDGLNHGDESTYFQRFTVDPAEEKADQEPFYWICHRATGKVLAIKDQQDQDGPGLKLSHPEVADSQLWKWDNGKLVSRSGEGVLTVITKETYLDKKVPVKRQLLVVKKGGETSWRLNPEGILSADDGSISIAAGTDGQGKSVYLTTPDPSASAQQWSLKQYIPTLSYGKNQFDTLRPGKEFMLYNSFAGKTLTANPAGKSVTLEQVPLEQPTDASQLAKIKPMQAQLWTYHDGVIVSAVDQTLVLHKKKSQKNLRLRTGRGIFA